MARELELKLRCTCVLSLKEIEQVLLSCDIHFEPVEGSGEPSGVAVSAKSKVMENAYFDTPDLLLHRHKVALRIRRLNGRYIQSLKTAGTSVDGVHQRGEWEWELSSPELEVSKLTGLHQVAGIDSFEQLDLKPVFNTDFERTSLVFHYKGARFELAYDVGCIRLFDSQNKQGSHADLMEQINEIEVEYMGSLAGSDRGGGQDCSAEDSDEVFHAIDLIKELATVLQEKLAVEPDDISKAQRGYTLYQRCQ